MPPVLRPGAASVGPTFHPPSTSLPSFPGSSHAQPMSCVTGPPPQWPLQYPPSMPRQLERPRQIIPQSVLPSPAFSAVSQTEASYVINSLQMTSGSSMVDSDALQLQNPRLMPSRFQPTRQIIPQSVPRSFSRAEPSYVTNRVHAASGSSVVDSHAPQLSYPPPRPSQSRQIVPQPVPPSMPFTMPAQTNLSYVTDSVQMTSSSDVIDSSAFPLQNPTPSHFEQARQIIPQPAPPPALAFTVPAQTPVSSHVANSVPAAPNSFAVDSRADLNVPPPQSVTAEDTASSHYISLDEDLMSWLADSIRPDILSSSEVDLGSLGDILSESSASVDGSAVAGSGASSSAANLSQTLTMNAELPDAMNIDFTTLMSELRQLNEFSGPL